MASLRPFELSPEEVAGASENVSMKSQSSQPSCSAFSGGIGSLAAGASITKMGSSTGSSSYGLFPNQNQYVSDKIPQQLRSIKPLSENLNPIEEECCFGGDDDDFLGRSKPPFSGFDQDNVIVPKTKQRQIPKIPFKVLDAPALKDDYYLNLVDWSEQNDLVVGLSSCVYIWSATSSKVTKLHDLGNTDEVTSVNWARRGTHLSVGTDSGVVQVWDLQAQKMVRNFEGHQGRVGALSWSSNILSSGSKDRAIHNHDLRCRNDSVSQLLGHK